MYLSYCLTEHELVTLVLQVHHCVFLFSHSRDYSVFIGKQSALIFLCPVDFVDITSVSHTRACNPQHIINFIGQCTHTHLQTGINCTDLNLFILAYQDKIMFFLISFS